MNRTNKPRQRRFSCQLEKNSHLHSFTDRQTKRCNCRPLRLFRSTCSQLNVEKSVAYLALGLLRPDQEAKAFESRLVMVVISRILFHFQRPLRPAKSLRRSHWPDQFEPQSTSFRAVGRDASRLMNESTRFRVDTRPPEVVPPSRMFNHLHSSCMVAASRRLLWLTNATFIYLFPISSRSDGSRSAEPGLPHPVRQ